MDKVNLLHPLLRTKAQQLMARATDAGFKIIITQTLRTKKEQDTLYAQGRTQPGPIITQARYPQSLHCWGLAFDIAVIIDGQANWNVAHYDQIGPIGESLGLAWGGRWSSFPDRPHFQLPGYEWSQLEADYGTPNKFIATWKEEKLMPEIPPWKHQVMKEAVQAGIIMPNIHQPQEPADKAFVLAVILNLLRLLTKN